MRKILISLILACSFSLISPNAATSQGKAILIGSQLERGFDMGVNSSEGKTDWLVKENGNFHLAYPAGQAWGAVFITVGKPKDPPRPSEDFSTYKTLVLEMKGQADGGAVLIGIKTNTHPDDGSELKTTVKLTKEWRTYHIPLEAFSGVDLKRLYVVTEFVFEGPIPRTVFIRKISFRK